MNMDEGCRQEMVAILVNVTMDKNLYVPRGVVLRKVSTSEKWDGWHFCRGKMFMK